MSKRLTLALSLLLLAAMALSLCPAAFAEGETAEEIPVIRIRTAEDLLELARLCSLDTWSSGKKVVLENDLSLSGVRFDSIPIFNGEFDGGHHTIYDLDLQSAQSPCGFILETGPDANIYDLNISGTVYTRGDDSVVGGIVGLNRGVLASSSFSGNVSAVSKIGGIAGRNETTGIIHNCVASGSVQGLSQTGGIVGENAGGVSDCENRAFVNTESVDPTLRLEAIDTSSILNFVHSLRTDNAGITTDTGGIAGSSGGFIENCSNTGTVGYLHLGYNVGGIAGHSNGYISGCRNSGEVYGRKDVGGVVGQGEPLLELTQAANLLDGITYRLYVLHQSLNDAIVDARSVADDIADRFSMLSFYLEPVTDALSGYDLTDPDTALYLQSIISDNMYSIQNELTAISDSVSGQSSILADDLQDINNNAAALTNTAIQTVNMISGIGQSADEVLVDNSEAEAQTLTFGKIADCDSSGSIYGDSNVGGIVGSLSVESEVDPESELRTGGSRLAQQQLNLRAVVVGCKNRGGVTAKRECAGGIAGKMDFGLASGCASYGPIALEDGDYAGGICGLCYGRIRNCWVKCSLGGNRYVGGVVGNGYRSDSGEDKSSMVSSCYALTRILGAPQFAGAVSGGGAGLYENNFFVPAGYAGLDRLSIQGKAEPVSFETFAAAEGIPAECTVFTLRFVLEGSVVKEIPFSYGASFDRSVFPDIPRRSGAYAVWDHSELDNLCFDTTVTAEYRLDETVLRSTQEREDGRACVYVDGQFQHGDELTLTSIPVSGEELRMVSAGWKDTVREQLHSIFIDHEPDYSIPVSVTERLRVSFPDDGLPVHSVRYLTPDGRTENCRIYLIGEDGWERIRPDIFGSYYLLDVPGTEAEFALVATIQSWWIVAYIAAALVILVLIAVLVIKLRRFLRARPRKARPPFAARRFPRWLRAHRKGVLIMLPILLLLTAATVVLLRVGSVGSAFSAYRALRTYANQECDIHAQVSIRSEERSVEMDTLLHRVRENGTTIRCFEQYGVPLYFSGGMVCLENGRVFRLADGQLSPAKLLDLAVDVFLREQLQKTTENGVTRYEAVIGGETADRILQLFLSASGEELLRAENMYVDMCTENGVLSSLSFSGDASAASGKGFAFDITLTPQPMAERPVVPRAVLDSIASGGSEGARVLSADFLKLLAAWVKMESGDTTSADVTVNADCGSLRLTPSYRYSRRSVDGTDIACMESALFKLYFTDSAACTASGVSLSDAQERVLDTAKLIPLARELFLNGQFVSTVGGGRSIYTLVLDSESAARLVSTLLPELDRLSIRYGDCRLRITLIDDALDSIELDCGGSLHVVARDIDASVVVSVRFNDDEAAEIPAAVREALIG